MKKYYTLLFFALFSLVGMSQIVNIPDANFKAYLLVYSEANIDTNGDGELQVSEAESVISLNIGTMGSSFNNFTGIQSFTNLQNLGIAYCESPGITLDLSGMSSLKHLDIIRSSLIINGSGLAGLESLSGGYFNIDFLNFDDCINLKNISFYWGVVRSLDLSKFPNLVTFWSEDSPLYNLNLTGLVNLSSFTGSSNIEILDLSDLINLRGFDWYGTSATQINLQNNVLLESLSVDGNNLTSIDISMLTNLTYLDCSRNNITSIDFSNSHKLKYINVSNNLFTSLDLSDVTESIPDFNYPEFIFNNNPNLINFNIKNGKYDSVSYLNCPNLVYICTDDFEFQNFSLPNVLFNNYCTFNPGGIYNTITGTATLDINNNGCDANDFHPKDLKISINDGTLSGSTFTNTTGNYSFFTQTGNFELTPQFENPYFTISPATATLNFASLDGSTQTQNFCIVPNGVHNDVEIAIIPLGNARPGFDANYHLIYKNKGNQTLSGAINLAFDDAVLDFVSAMPTLDNQSANNLVWNYTNLLPFESRIINFILNVNSPQEIPAVNINDILNFTAAINPISGDETVTDNTFTLNQMVIGSYDPNDKTCLEGNTISPDKVGDYLHYLIRFQNSGTAPAENIVVKDMIDTTKFDINSLQLTSTSHPQVTRIKDDKVEFIFEGINLPAEQDNELASHGYVTFKIKTKNNLVLGNSVSNTAAIYFDYNFPIHTNTATSTVAVLSNTEFENKSVRMYPNPAKNNLTIVAKETITSVQLFDVQGRLISTKLNAATETNLDLSQQSSGAYFVKVFTDNGVKIEKVVKE